MNKKQAYQNILKELKKQKEIIDDNSYVEGIENSLTNRVKAIEVCELFDIPDLLKEQTGTYHKIGENRAVQFFYPIENNNWISWSDDGRQPENEWLYKISFPTGAFIFGDFYPAEMFQKFFLELKSYNPKYCDTTNNCLYFSPDNAKKVHEAYPKILKKYRDKSAEEFKKLRKEKLEKELERLNDE